MWPEKDDIKHKGPTVLSAVRASFGGYSFAELDKMTTRELVSLKEVTLEVLAAARQKRYTDIATIMWLQTEIEKERV